MALFTILVKCFGKSLLHGLSVGERYNTYSSIRYKSYNQFRVETEKKKHVKSTTTWVYKVNTKYTCKERIESVFDGD